MADEDITVIEPDVARTTASEGYAASRRMASCRSRSPACCAEKLALARDAASARTSTSRRARSLRKLLRDQRARGRPHVGALARCTTTASSCPRDRRGAERGSATSSGSTRPFVEARGTVKLELTGDLPAAHPTRADPARRAAAHARAATTSPLDESVALSAATRARPSRPSAPSIPGPEHNLDPVDAGAAARPLNLARRSARRRSSPCSEARRGAVRRQDRAHRAAHRRRAALARRPLPRRCSCARRARSGRGRGARGSPPRSCPACARCRSATPGAAWTSTSRSSATSTSSSGCSAASATSAARTTSTPGGADAGRDLGGPGRPARGGECGDRGPASRSRSSRGPAGRPGRHRRRRARSDRPRAAAAEHGSRATVNASPPALALKARLLERLSQYVDTLGFGEPVRAAEVIGALMEEPGIVDVRNLGCLRYPPGYDAGLRQLTSPEEIGVGANVDPRRQSGPGAGRRRRRIQVQAG